MDENAQYRLHVLGGFRLARGARELKLPRRKAGSLLAYLALDPRRRSREELATLFWGDYPDSQARVSLRAALASLRLAVGSDIVVADQQSAQINPTFPLWIDARAFEDYARCFLAASPIDLSPSFIDLYGGDLLAGCNDDWVIPERERLRALYVDVLLHAAQLMRARSEYDRAVEFARRVLAIEPANERAHQHLMFCFVALGDRSAALQQYALCERALRADLDVAPMPETRSLHQWIKGQPAHTPVREARITNLPIPLSSFVGREREMAEIKRRLAETRLLTLAGPGGGGKTRLAIQVAADLVDAYKDGVWFADLSGVLSASLVPSVLAQALGINDTGGRPHDEAVTARLYARRVLIVLDNCERLVAACAQLARAVLSTSPGVTILATSREPLGLTGEIVWAVPPLSTPECDAVPPSLAALAGFEATRLFVERATATYPALALADSDAPAVAAVCRRLDGLPLAVELAAARVRVLSVNEIVERLDQRFALLTTGDQSAPPRQASLRAAIDWSYDLLSAAEQTMLRRLSTFAGTFSLAGAAAVWDDGQSETAALDILARLVDKSLVAVVANGDHRRYCLQETIRLYARERLVAANEEASVRKRYVAFYVAQAAEHFAPVVGFRRSLAFFRSEHANVRQALAWSQEDADVEHGTAIIYGMWAHWVREGDAPQLRPWLNQIIPFIAGLPPSARYKALLAVGVATRAQDYGRAIALAEEALALARAEGDTPRIASAAHWIGRFALEAGRDDLARQRLEEALTIGGEDDQCVAYGGLLDLGELALRDGQHERAQTLLEQALDAFQRKDSLAGMSSAFLALGHVAGARGDPGSAMRLSRRALACAIEGQNRGQMLAALDGVAAAAAGNGHSALAARLLAAADSELSRRGGLQRAPRPAEWYNAACATVRADIGDEAFRTAYAAGQTMSFDEAIVYALLAQRPLAAAVPAPEAAIA